MRKLLNWAKRLLMGMLVLGLFLGLVFYLLTSVNGRSITIPEQVHYVRDEQGRALVLHGVNDDGCAKSQGLPCAGREVIEKEAAAGFNFVRYLTNWEHIEPRRGEYDEAYLDSLPGVTLITIARVSVEPASAVSILLATPGRLPDGFKEKLTSLVREVRGGDPSVRIVVLREVGE